MVRAQLLQPMPRPAVESFALAAWRAALLASPARCSACIAGARAHARGAAPADAAGHTCSRACAVRWQLPERVRGVASAAAHLQLCPTIAATTTRLGSVTAQSCSTALPLGCTAALLSVTTATPVGSTATPLTCSTTLLSSTAAPLGTTAIPLGCTAAPPEHGCHSHW
eukprot:364806-Chlamydomonas_euryale.AAC.11